MTTGRRLDPGEDFAYLGSKQQEYRGYLDTFPNPGASLVRMTSDEVTSVCPITGQADFEVVDITYSPRERCIESKALKLFLASLRNVGAFVEALAVEVARAVTDAIEPEWVRVEVTQKPRGGISIVAVTVLYRHSDSGEFVPIQTSFTSTPPRNFYLEH